MEKLLTIVIPTYNMEAYLDRCLGSLIVDESLMRLLDVLVINDGSKDGSSKIAHKYENDYPETFRVIDKENGNYGSCVNRGLAEARGRYIKILDADDWFDTIYFSEYIKELYTFDADMVLTPFQIHAKGHDDIKTVTQNLIDGQKFDFQGFPKEKINRYSMHMVTYKTTMLRDNHYIQTEGISYTDTEWTHIPQFFISDFIWCPLPVYQYLTGREGQTMDSLVLKKSIWLYEVIVHSLVENRKSYDPRKYALAYELNCQQILFLASSIYRTILILNRPSKEDLIHLKAFDSYLFLNCFETYSALSHLSLKNWLPIRYVQLWRKTGFRIPLNGARSLYRIIRYGK